MRRGFLKGILLAYLGKSTVPFGDSVLRRTTTFASIVLILVIGKPVLSLTSGPHLHSDLLSRPWLF